MPESVFVQVQGVEHASADVVPATPLPSVPAMDLLFAASPLPQSLSRRLDGALLAVNDAWVRLTGIARAQALGRTSLQLAQWPSAMERQDYLESIERGEPSYTVESYGERGLRVRLSTTRLMHEGQELLLVGWEDITREHEAESRLMEANRRLQQQLELHEATEKLARVGHWTNPQDAEQVIWSAGLREMVGVRPDEALTREQARSILHEDDRAAWMEARQALDGRLIEFRIRTMDGQIRWVRSRMGRTTVWGNPDTDFGVVQDVTVEKQALEAQASQADLIHHIAARVPGLIYQARLRPDGRSEIPFVNDAVRDLLELDADELRQDASALFSRVHQDDLVSVLQALADSAENLKPWRQLYRAVLPSRGVRWMRVEAVPQREPDGSTLWHGFTSDVTELQQATETLMEQHLQLEAATAELARQKQTLRVTLDSMSQGITQVDKNRRTIVYNQRFLDMLDLPESLMATQPTHEQITAFQRARGDFGENGALVEDDARRYVIGEQGVPMPSHYLRKTRDGRTLEVRTRQLEHGGMVRTFSDVTTYVQVQEEVRRLNATLEQRVKERTAELERSMRDMEIISYSIAHDLRAPLRAVNGFASLIADEGEELRPMTRDMFQRISRASANMGQMISDMLELLRVVRADLTPAPVNLAALARSAADALAPGMEQDELLCEVMPPALGDATLLRQVLLNLLDNAIKYVRPNERPRVVLGYDAVRAAYFLRDQGRGFDMARAEKLFGLFQRMHAGMEIPGTGVGLAIVARIIERHGGRIWADSQPGQGTTFWWTLPTA